jgi:hypothetical protein
MQWGGEWASYGSVRRYIAELTSAAKWSYKPGQGWARSSSLLSSSSSASMSYAVCKSPTLFMCHLFAFFKPLILFGWTIKHDNTALHWTVQEKHVSYHGQATAKGLGWRLHPTRYYVWLLNFPCKGQASEEKEWTVVLKVKKCWGYIPQEVWVNLLLWFVNWLTNQPSNQATNQSSN